MKEPQEELNTQKVDDFVGIRYILITNDHEPWCKGSPEIEVRYRTWFFWPGLYRDNKFGLGAVNKENTWCSLGDPNSTYLYFNDQMRSPFEVAVWERDSGDDDDFLGVFFVNWRSLPFAGYAGPLSNGDAQIYVDRD